MSVCASVGAAGILWLWEDPQGTIHCGFEHHKGQGIDVWYGAHTPSRLKRRVKCIVRWGGRKDLGKFRYEQIQILNCCFGSRCRGLLLLKFLPKHQFRPLCCIFGVVSRYVQSYVKPGMKMTEICQRLERKTHELVVACLAAFETTSIPSKIHRSFMQERLQSVWESFSTHSPFLCTWHQPGERPGSWLGLPHWSWCLDVLSTLMNWGKP